MTALLDKWKLLQAIIADRRLSPTAKLVAAVLLDHLNSKTGRCDPSLDRVAIRIGRRRRAVSGAIGELITAGWLGRRRRRGTSFYRFNRELRPNEDVQDSAPLLDDDDVQDSAHLHVQDSASLDVQKSAHESGKVKPGSRTHETVPQAQQYDAARAHEGEADAAALQDLNGILDKALGQTPRHHISAATQKTIDDAQVFLLEAALDEPCDLDTSRCDE